MVLALDDDLIATARNLVERGGAESIVVLGAVTAGAARRIEDRVPVPVLDGMRDAIPLAEALVRIGTRKLATGSDASPGERQTSAIDPALASMLSKRG